METPQKTTPKSALFDDIYFSPEDGRAETRHVFLDGNNLPKNWQGRDRFIIAETGFGTGLNFFCAWELFEQTAQPDQKLDFISFEQYPLSAEDIARYLTPMVDEQYLSVFLQHYPLPVPTVHKLYLTPQVTLTLLIGDINAEIGKLEASVDAWFLDGFAPAKNPHMWSETVFDNIARLSKPGTNAATFTAAGIVRRGLEGAGFHIDKVKGYGRKREMLRGVFQ